MDRTSWIGIIVCLSVFLGLKWYTDKYYPPPPPKPHVASVAASTPSTPSEMTSATPAPATTPGVTTPPAPTEKFTYLENDAIKVTLTSLGAAITEVELKLHRADNGGNVILNEHSRSNVMAVSGWPGVDQLNFDSQQTGDDNATFTAQLPNGVKWQRAYTFGPETENNSGLTGFVRVTLRKLMEDMGHPSPKPQVYTIDVTDTLTNPGATDVTLPAYLVSVGRAEPLYDMGTGLNRGQSHYNSNQQYLGSGWLASKFYLTTLNAFQPGAIPIIGIKTSEGKDQFSSKMIDPAALHWIGVENQFFTVLLTPADNHLIDQGMFYCFNQRDANGYVVIKRVDGYVEPDSEPDIEAAAQFPTFNVPAGQSVTQTYSIYAGPKDFNRLDALGANQGELMNYGVFEILIVPMLTVLHFWFGIFGNYGVAIILLTLMVKAITWPLQSYANRSGKQMQALAPMLKEVQAKYKEHPEKLQTETFALYREYGVNPFRGCLPALIQMPVFFSLYFMLQNAVELRGQSFLWVHDLTKPDNVLSLPITFLGFHPELHPLPIMVTALTMVMMRMTPQLGDPTQARVAQMMPLIFLFIFYNFAAALSLYYVVNNFVSIIQIYRNLKKPLPALKRVPQKKKTLS